MHFSKNFFASSWSFFAFLLLLLSFFFLFSVSLTLASWPITLIQIHATHNWDQFWLFLISFRDPVDRESACWIDDRTRILRQSSTYFNVNFSRFCVCVLLVFIRFYRFEAYDQLHDCFSFSFGIRYGGSGAPFGELKNQLWVSLSIFIQLCIFLLIKVEIVLI